MQEQVEDQELAGLARSRPAVARPTASTDPGVLAPVPAPLDCPYLHLDADGPGCLALAPAIRLSRRQVELVCAVAAHLACPRLLKADAGRAPAPTEPPPAIVRRGDRPSVQASSTGALPLTELAPAADQAPTAGPWAADHPTAAPAEPDVEPAALHGPTSEPMVERAAPTRPPVPAPPRPVAAAGRDASREPAASREPGATPSGPSRVAAALTLARVTARTHIVLRPATALAWVILVGTLAIVIALLSARGGLTLPAGASPSPGLAGASPSPGSPSPTIAISPSPSTLATPTASPSASPISTPSPPPPSPSPSASEPFPPDRLAVLTACPGKPGCYQYKIKSGDNLANLAKFFGVTYAALKAANPQLANPSVIHRGDLITIPLPVPTPSPTPSP